MFNKFFTLILLLSINISISAQTLLKGKVSDSNGIVLTGVQVFLHQNKTGAVSDQEGNYELSIPSNLKIFTLEYSLIGYRSKSETVDLTKTSSDKVFILDVKLVESPIELQEITVTTGFVEEQEALPYPIETVTKKEITSSGTINLSQTLNHTTGIYSSSFGSGVGKPVIRGLSNANIIMLNNGIKLENFNFSSSHPFLADEFSASRIELIKGAASLQYGSDAVGGAVNIIREQPAQPNSLEGDFISHYHSNTNGYLNSLGLKGSFGKFFLGVRGSLKSHKDFTDGNDETVNNTRFNEQNLSANAGIRTGFGIFSLNYNYTDAQYGIQNQNQINLFNNPIASALFTEDRKNQLWFQTLENHLFSSNNTIFLKKSILDIDLAYQMNKREGIGGGLNSQQELVIPTFASMQLNTFTYNVKMHIPMAKHKFIFGVNGANVQNEADETKPNNPLLDSKINDVGIYTIGNFSLSEKLSLTAGLRYDYRGMQSFPTATQNTNQFQIDKTYNNLTGSAGITYAVSKSQFFKANIARGFRSPTLPELTQNGIHAGRYEIGNPDLEAQSNFQIDFNYHLHLPWLTFNLSPFYNVVNNYIYLVMTSENAPIGNGKIFENVQNDANLIGGEVSLDLHPLKWLGIHGSYSMVRANITDDAEGVEHPTFTPQDRLIGEIKFEQKKMGFLKRPYFSVEVMHFFEQNLTGQNEAVTSAYTLLNARIGTSLSVAGKDMDIFIVGNNLANVVYIDHLSFTKQLNLNMMGRNIMLGLRLPFGFKKKSE